MNISEIFEAIEKADDNDTNTRLERKVLETVDAFNVAGVLPGEKELTAYLNRSAAPRKAINSLVSKGLLEEREIVKFGRTVLDLTFAGRKALDN